MAKLRCPKKARTTSWQLQPIDSPITSQPPVSHPILIGLKMEVMLSFLGIKLRTSLEDGCLRMDSPGLVRLLSFGAYRRTVLIDPGRCSIEFTTSLFGRHRRREFHLSEISRLDYRFVETGIQTGSAWLGSHDSTEWFTLEIVLKKDREHLLIGRFIGGGNADHGWEGILAMTYNLQQAPATVRTWSPAACPPRGRAGLGRDHLESTPSPAVGRCRRHPTESAEIDRPTFLPVKRQKQHVRLVSCLTGC